MPAVRVCEITRGLRVTFVCLRRLNGPTQTKPKHAASAPTSTSKPRAKSTATGGGAGRTPQQTMRPVPVTPASMMRQLFDKFKNDARLGKDEYKAFLCVVGEWGCRNYTDEKWRSTWPTECKTLQTTVSRGIDFTAFKFLYTEYRTAAQLQSDFTVAYSGCSWSL